MHKQKKDCERHRHLDTCSSPFSPAYVCCSDLTFGTEEYLASSDAQLLYWSPTYGAVLVFHVWTHRRSVATLRPVKIEELVFSI